MNWLLPAPGSLSVAINCLAINKLQLQLEVNQVALHTY